MKKKKASLWIFLTIFVLLLLFPIFLLAAGSLMGVEELRESYGSVLYGTGGKLHWKLDVYKRQVKYVTPLTCNAWERKVIRFYDPDGTLIEVGETR